MKHDEDKLVEGCKLYFEYSFPFTEHWRFFHIPNGGFRNLIEATRFKRIGVKAGVPDVCIILNNGYTCWLEFKNPNGKGRLSDQQLQYRDNLIKSRHFWFLISSLDDFKNALEEIKDLI